MDPKLVKIAKDIPGQFKELLGAMFDASEPALRSGVTTLRQSLSKLDTYLQQVEREHLGTKPATIGAKVSPMQPVKKTRRRGGRFPISTFVLNELRQAGKAMRPVELAEKLSQETGRAKESAMANINTLLSRLRQTKKVTSKDGLYSATGSAKTATTSPTMTKKTGKRGRKRKAGKRFQTGPFVIETLKKNSKGMRPVDVSKALAQAAPGQHKSPLSVVNTTLKRLKDQGQVVNKSGIWSLKAA